MEKRLTSLFTWIVAKRWWVVASYLVLMAPAAYFATRVKQDNSLDRLMVQSDPDYVNNREFQKTFGGGEYVLLLAETPDPYAPAVVRQFDAIEKTLAAIDKVQVSSALAVYRQAKNGFGATDDEIARFKEFATGTQLFKQQHIVGDHYLVMPLILAVKNRVERAIIVNKINDALVPFEKTIAAGGAPITNLRKVGEPFVNVQLDEQSARTGTTYFPLFMLFVVIVNVSLYRSWRALLAFLILLGVSAALTLGYVGATHGDFTIVSSLVPMTVLITCTATLVYLHSRFVDRPEGVDVDTHQIFALVNKFPASAASVFATAVGFAALAVSKIRPIREMGIWVAVGLVFTFIAVFTLFPALQKILRTPTRVEKAESGTWLTRLAAFIPGFSYTWRWPLVLGSLACCGAGLIALLGLPNGMLAPMQLQTNPLEYINPHSTLYRDTKAIEPYIAGLSMTEVWLSGRFGTVSDPESLRGLNDYETRLAKDPLVGSVIGPTTILRTIRYVGGKGDTFPTSDASLQAAADELETLLPQQPMLQRFIDKQLAQTHVSVVTKMTDYKGFQKVDARLREIYAESATKYPALKNFQLKTTGLGPLQAKISIHLVPTLTESFAITIVIIFGTFILVFRSGPARLMAMIPSLFAILVMFGFMRILGMSLNVATILIASTVLGTSENDQIHFFYHFLEKRKIASTEACLRHTFQVAGRAIVFATLINAGGFLAFGLADLPPVRQFGILSALAFVLSMIADFTALPAALWIVFREKPDAVIAARASK